ncbi:MAG: hypothetical protein ABIZ07_06775 [Dermatophilaceae bacterium]
MLLLMIVPDSQSQNYPVLWILMAAEVARHRASVARAMPDRDSTAGSVTP